MAKAKANKSLDLSALSNEELIALVEQKDAAFNELLQEHQALQDKYQLLLQEHQALALAPAASTATPGGLPTDVFEVDGAKYQMAAGKLKIKGVGERTAAEVLYDNTEYPALGNRTIKAWLVSYGSAAVKQVQ